MRKKYTQNVVLSFRLREADANLARALAAGRDETFSDRSLIGLDKTVCRCNGSWEFPIGITNPCGANWCDK